MPYGWGSAVRTGIQSRLAQLPMRNCYIFLEEGSLTETQNIKYLLPDPFTDVFWSPPSRNKYLHRYGSYKHRYNFVAVGLGYNVLVYWIKHTHIKMW